MSDATAPAPAARLVYETERHPDPVVAQFIDEVEELLRRVAEKRSQIAERLKHGTHTR